MAEYLVLRTVRNKFKFGSNYYGRIAFNKWISRFHTISEKVKNETSEKEKCKVKRILSKSAFFLSCIACNNIF